MPSQEYKTLQTLCRRFSHVLEGGSIDFHWGEGGFGPDGDGAYMFQLAEGYVTSDDLVTIHEADARIAASKLSDVLYADDRRPVYTGSSERPRVRGELTAKEREWLDWALDVMVETSPDTMEDAGYEGCDVPNCQGVSNVGVVDNLRQFTLPMRWDLLSRLEDIAAGVADDAPHPASAHRTRCALVAKLRDLWTEQRRLWASDGAAAWGLSTHA